MLVLVTLHLVAGSCCLDKPIFLVITMTAFLSKKKKKVLSKQLDFAKSHISCHRKYYANE
jgi:hypothetical protein